MIGTPAIGRFAPSFTLTDWLERPVSIESLKVQTETLTDRVRNWRIPTQSGHLIVQAEAPPSWFEPALEALIELLQLERGWDSYGAREIEPRAILLGLDLLSLTMREGAPLPLVVPSPRGGIQFEWHVQGAEVETEVLPNGRFSFYWEREPAEPDVEFVGDINQVRSALAEAIDHMMIPVSA